VHATNFAQILSTALWPRAGSGVVRLTRSVSWPDVVQGD